MTRADVITDALFEVTEIGLDGERGSVTDASLGPLSVEGRSVVCPTCWNTRCLGHWAYIDLGDYFLYPGKIRSCLNILKSICFHCRGPTYRCSEEGNLLAKPNHCSRKQPKYSLKKIGGVSMILVKSQEEKYTLHPIHIRKFFKHTPATTWKSLRLSNPADEFFVRYLPVCPPSMRPKVANKHDPLTLCYNDIVIYKKDLVACNRNIKNTLARVWD